MILTFKMSQAQTEGETLSGNVKWGYRKNFNKKCQQQVLINQKFHECGAARPPRILFKL